MSAVNGGGRLPPRGPVLGLEEGRAAAAGTRRLRLSAGLTQGQLAVRLGYSLSWLRQREQGGLRMTRAEAELAAGALGTDYAGLLAAGRDVITAEGQKR